METSEKITIREAQPSDMDFIYDLIYQLAIHEKRPEDFTADKGHLADLIFTRQMAQVRLAFLNDKPMAFMLYYPVVSTFSGHLNYYVEDLFVLPAGRRYGIGKRMLTSLRDEPGIEGLKWTCLTDNEEGLTFHHAIGGQRGLACYPFYLNRSEDDGSAQ